ncbi:hypothetical protein PFISCL1PPCAC_25628, partial [Pristionchus fissidentatus]
TQDERARVVRVLPRLRWRAQDAVREGHQGAECRRVHHPQGGPHARQPAQAPAAQGPARALRRLQEPAPARAQVPAARPDDQRDDARRRADQRDHRLAGGAVALRGAIQGPAQGEARHVEKRLSDGSLPLSLISFIDLPPLPYPILSLKQFRLFSTSPISPRTLACFVKFHRTLTLSVVCCI